MSMEKEGNYAVQGAASSSSMAAGAQGFEQVQEYQDQQHMQQIIKPRPAQFDVQQNDYMNFSQQQQDQTGLLGFSDVMHFADFGPKLGLNQSKMSDEEETGIDPVYFLKFPVLNDKPEGEGGGGGGEELLAVGGSHEGEGNEGGGKVGGEEKIGGSATATVEAVGMAGKNKRKRGRAVKTSEEVESQRMTHIAVERNRRKQMNEHLRVLRSLIPGSYVQRGDQASIIGGSIEFIRELEQLLQCLESQKRRRIYGDNPVPSNNPATRPIIGGVVISDATANTGLIQQQQPMLFPNTPIIDHHQTNFDPTMDQEEEDVAENKSCLADVEVKILGFDAVIKILSRRRPGQLIRTIAGLEDLHLVIVHTNITTIEQTVLYSFNVKVSSETRFSAEDIAGSVQQIFSFIHANTSNNNII